MKAFQFRLERVLHFFRRQELVQSMVVADVERRIRETEARRQERIEQKANVEHLIRTQHQSLTHEELMRSYAHSEFLSKIIGTLDEELVLVRELLDQERAHLLELTKRRRVVEELRNRKRETYDAEIERLEIASLDELNGRRVPAYSAKMEDELC